ncbi:hypothetical protein M3J09_009800 [Ascochyta lentis]
MAHASTASCLHSARPPLPHHQRRPWLITHHSCQRARAALQRFSSDSLNLACWLFDQLPAHCALHFVSASATAPGHGSPPVASREITTLGPRSCQFRCIMSWSVVARSTLDACRLMINIRATLRKSGSAQALTTSA